jgi:drug/metabolite transporter (DMT)-like permease
MANLVLILFSVFMSSTGQMLMKLGANRLGSVFLSRQDLLPDIGRILTTPQILLGILLYAAGFLSWVKVLTREDLSYTYPMASLSYIIVFGYSYFLFKEPVSISKMVG